MQRRRPGREPPRGHAAAAAAVGSEGEEAGVAEAEREGPAGGGRGARRVEGPGEPHGGAERERRRLEEAEVGEEPRRRHADGDGDGDSVRV